MAGMFKEYDIRGVYGEDLTDDIAYKIGRAYVMYANSKKVVVGHDMRVSGDKLKKALVDGLTDQGCDVVDIGLCSTPMLSYAAGSMNLGGIMVTASHNPAKYNGFKMSKDGTVPLYYEEGIKQIEEKVEKNLFPDATKAKVIQKDIIDEYVKFCLKFAHDIKKFDVVVDAGNGMAGLTAKKVFDKLPCNLTKMFFALDGSFPNHDANPMKPENIIDLQKKVKEVSADVGIAFDGDADRVVFVDENGDAISSDMITTVIGKEILKSNPKSTVIYDLRSSWATKEGIESSEGKALLTRVGHSYIKKSMRENDAVFAGELSGHYYFRDTFFTDNGMVAVMFVLSYLSATGENLSDVIKQVKKYFHTGEINFKVDDVSETLEKVEKHYGDAEDVKHLDGVSVEYKDWWFNLRKSNTEPLVRLNLEAKSKELMEEKKKEVVELIEG